MFRTSSLFLILLMLCAVASAQQNVMTHLTNPEKRGDRMFYYFSYKAALDDYKLALKVDPEKDYLKLKIAECYRLLNDPANSQTWYAEVVNDETIIKPEHILHYAQALSSNGNYEESKKWYAHYQLKVGDDSRSEKKITTINTITDLYKDSLTYFIDPLKINSPTSDFSPAFYANGIVFLSARAQEIGVRNIFSWNKSSFLDMYYSVESEDGSNAPPERFHKNVNTRLHEGPTVFYDNGTKMIFTRNNLLNGKQGESKDGVVKLKLFYSERIGNEWSKPKPLPFNNNEYSVGHPTLSTDGKTLYFVSDMPGGRGGTDIYISKWENGTWSTPVNAGNEINTEGNEMFPFLYNDTELYVASNGHGGLGGLDIYGFNLADRKITNMGAPLNSNADDFGIILHDGGLSGYFTSNRKGGAGDDDLYHFRVNRELIEVIAVDKVTGAEIPQAEASLIEAEKVSQKYFTSENGSASFPVNPRKNYVVRVSKEGYLPSEAKVEVVELQKENTLKLRVPLERLSKEISTVITDTTKRIVDFTKPDNTKLNPSDSTNDAASVSISGLSKATVFQLQNVSGSLQELLAVNGKTFLIATNDLSLTNNTGQSLLSWSTPLSKEVLPRQSFLRSQLATLGYEAEFISIQNIYYDYDKSVIRNDASKDLDRIVRLLEAHPEIELLLHSHTDSRGSDGYNAALAKKRAVAAYQYLVNEGVSANRLLHTGFGEKELVNDCTNTANCDEAAHQLNRRTEFKIVFKK